MRTLFITALLFSAACGGGSGGGPSPAELTELDSLARVPNRAVALESALLTAGTIVASGTDSDILSAVAGHLATETNNCAKTTNSGSSLAITFMPTTGTGCQLATGDITLGGTATVTIAHADTTVQIVTHFDGTAQNEPWSGELVIATSDGNSFTMSALTKLNGYEADIPMFTGIPESSQSDITANGTTPGTTAADKSALTFTNVTQLFYTCHPDAGSIALAGTTDTTARTLTYSSESVTSGAATYVDSTGTYTVTLPTNGSCPATQK